MDCFQIEPSEQLSDSTLEGMVLNLFKIQKWRKLDASNFFGEFCYNQ